MPAWVPSQCDASEDLSVAGGGVSEDGNGVRRGMTVFPPGESQGLLPGERASGCWQGDAAAAVTCYVRRVPSAEKRCSYLVDPASSHMLVSKTKPCTCKYERSSLRNCEWLIKSVTVHLTVPPTWITVAILELIHASGPDCPSPGTEGTHLLDTEPARPRPPGRRPFPPASHDNCADRRALRRRWFIRVSALSTFDGRVLAYHGCNG